MTAYARLMLVTPTFPPSDIAFARGWGRLAPGLGGWNVLFDNDAAPELVLIVPPGADRPAFFVTRHGREVILECRRAMGDDDEVIEVGRFDGLREALQAVCPVDDARLEQVQAGLERDFRRARSR